MRVYVSGPLSKGDVLGNVRRAVEAADELLALGHIPYVPHLTVFWHFHSPKPYESWMALDFAWLEVCDAVLRLPGESEGADREVDRARELGVPIYESVSRLKHGALLDNGARATRGCANETRDDPARTCGACLLLARVRDVVKASALTDLVDAVDELRDAYRAREAGSASAAGEDK